jgi:predicted Fe-Mo cluster-binding NifX family protein
MKTALTVWGDRISPVFDAAHTFLLAEIDNQRVISRNMEPFDPDHPSQTADRLVDLNVATLICGAISELPARLIETRGIEIISFIAGDAEEVLAAYARGKKIVPVFLMPGCKKKQCRCSGKREKQYVDDTPLRRNIAMPRGDGTGPKGLGPKSGRGRGRCTSGRKSQGSAQKKQVRRSGNRRSMQTDNRRKQT